MRARRGTVAALLLTAVVSGCTGISTDPQLPLSLQFDSLPALAIVVGDTMRGGDLLPARVPVKVFSSTGSTVSDSQIRVLGIDSVSVRAFSVVGGLQLRGRVETATVRIVAQAGALQSQTQTFAVHPRPTLLGIGDTTSDSIVYDGIDTTTRFRDVSATLYRKVGDSTARFLDGLRVRFRVASFTDSILDSVRIIPTAGGRAISSTLVTSGLATVRVKAFPKSGARGRGSVSVEASFSVFGAPVAGSPLRLPVALVPFTIRP